VPRCRRISIGAQIRFVNVNADQLGKEFGCTGRTIRNLTAEGMPKAGRGEYDLERCKSWYIHYLKSKLRQGAGAEGEDPGAYNVDRERARLTKAQAEQAEIELEEKKRQVIPIAAFKDAMGKMIGQARQQLLQLPGRVAHELANESAPVIKLKLTNHIHKALTALSEAKHGPNA
jgi:phage terminase Nu1 subunit (DNA packaging protein)